jgi:hypothetical protein
MRWRARFVKQSRTGNKQPPTSATHPTGRRAGNERNSRQIPQKAAEVMDNLNDSTRRVHQLISEIAKPDQPGMSAGANIRESLMNANTATSNLADATEALKRKGYYDLAEISPEDYRKEKAFTDSKKPPSLAIEVMRCSKRVRKGRSYRRRGKRS